MEFNVGKWLSRILYEPAYYSDLCDYVESNEHLDAHILSRPVLSLSEDRKIRRVADVPEDRRQFVIDSMSSSITSATETFSRQMIVVAVTLTEGMIGEYAECLFFRHPKRMHDYLEVGGNKGVVSLNILTENKTQSEIFSVLARNCSTKVMEGKFEKCLLKIEKLSNLEIDARLKDELGHLANLRNKIVHEVKYPTIERDAVKSAFESMYQFLIWLGTAAKKNDVPLDDPAQIIVT